MKTKNKISLLNRVSYYIYYGPFILKYLAFCLASILFVLTLPISMPIIFVISGFQIPVVTMILFNVKEVIEDKIKKTQEKVTEMESAKERLAVKN